MIDDYERTPVCGLCGDTGHLWGRREHGPCPRCFDPDAELTEAETLERRAMQHLIVRG